MSHLLPRFSLKALLPALIAVVLLGTLCAPLAAQSSTLWRTVNGDEYQGALIGIDGGDVLVKGHRNHVFRIPLAELDEAGRAAALERGAVDATTKATLKQQAAAAGAAARSSSPITKLLDSNLIIRQGNQIVPYNFAARPEPEYYAFYFSASWCGPCKRYTPVLSRFYQEMKQAGYDNFELIFVSSDNSEAMQKRYMLDSAMPWPALAYGQCRNQLVNRFSGRGIPCLVITDKFGKVLHHSYEGQRYLGPDVAKEGLRSLLAQSRKR